MIDSQKGGIACPHCASNNIELSAAFGQQLLTTQYYCNACRTPFERVKGDDVLSDVSRRIDAAQADRMGR